MTVLSVPAVRHWLSTRRNLSIFWQIVALCTAMIALTIAGAWLAADVLAGHNKALLSARYGVSAEVAHRVFLDALHQSLAMALLAGLVASVAAGSVFVPKVLKPFREMAASADQVAEGDFSVRVPLGKIPPECEIYALGGAFNRMAMRLEFIEAARKRMIADLSHDLLVAAVDLRGYIEGVRDGVVTLSPQTITILEGEIARLISLLNDLNHFNLAEGRRATLRAAPHDVHDLLDEARRFAGITARQRALSIDLAVDASAGTLFADRDAVLRALQNVIDNALRHADPHSVIRLSARGDDRWLEIACTNTGDTIPPGDLPLVFERFYRADPARTREGGAGLGLAITKELIEAHDGKVSALSGDRETKIVIRFPRYEPDVLTQR